MSDSIMSNERKCYITGRTDNLHKHHIFPGNPNRRISEKYGCWCYLTGEMHNQSSAGVHYNKELDMKLRCECQARFEKAYPLLSFRNVFGANYL